MVGGHDILSSYNTSIDSRVWHSTVAIYDISPPLPTPNKEYDVSLIKEYLILSGVGDFDFLSVWLMII